MDNKDFRVAISYEITSNWNTPQEGKKYRYGFRYCELIDSEKIALNFRAPRMQSEDDFQSELIFQPGIEHFMRSSLILVLPLDSEC